MNETQEFGACTSIFTQMRFIGMNADQSRELQGPIVAAVCRHFGLQPEAVTVLGHRTASEHDNDAHADDLHDRRLHPNHTHAVVDLELRERTDAANDTVARASLPLDPWVVEALREEFLDRGAMELGIDVEALEIFLKLRGTQVDTHAPTPAPTRAPAGITNARLSLQAPPQVGGYFVPSQGPVLYGAAIAILGSAGVGVRFAQRRCGKQKADAKTSKTTETTVKKKGPTLMAKTSSNSASESLPLNQEAPTQPQILEFKATLENMNYAKLIDDTELFEATKQTVAAGLARKAEVSEGCVEVKLSQGSVKIDAGIQILPASPKDAAVIMADLKKPSTGSELLQSLAQKPRFTELKEDPRKDFTISAISVVETVVEYAPEQRPKFGGSNIADLSASQTHGSRIEHDDVLLEVASVVPPNDAQQSVLDVGLQASLLPSATTTTSGSAGQSPAPSKPLAVYPDLQATKKTTMNEFGEFVDTDGNMVNIAELLPGTSKRLEEGEGVIHTDAQVEGGFRSMFSCAAPCATAPATLCSPCATMAPASAVTVIASAGDAASDAASDLE